MRMLMTGLHMLVQENSFVPNLSRAYMFLPERFFTPFAPFLVLLVVSSNDFAN